MTKDELIADFYKRYEELKTALKSANIDRIRELSLDVHAMVHPAEVSGIDVYALREYMLAVGRNTREILRNLTLEQVRSMVPEERVMRILEVGGVTTDFRSVWLLVFWGRLTGGGMILTPITGHHMMHLPQCV